MAAFEVMLARIETLALDAVVNAANRHLAPGAGVDGALRRAAGPELTRATQKLGPIPEGAAVLTPGFDAPARYIIHVAAPIWFVAGAAEDKIVRLAACYTSALALAADNSLTSIAFPCLGTGNFGWPRELACETALAACREAHRVERVVFCCFSEADAELYRDALAAK